MDKKLPEPFPHCPPMDGCHCQSSSLAKIFHHAGHPLSEEMILGLGAGQGYFYWHQKNTWPFVGGRSNTKNFFADLGSRCGVEIRTRSTSSIRTAYNRLLEKLEKQEPVMIFGDMAYLPWFSHMPEGYHFGGHTFVICGYDGDETFLAADINPKQTGYKKGFYAGITKAQLEQARNSPYKPFPPKNTMLDFDFSRFRPPGPEDIHTSIRQTVNDMIHPPISNMGVKGIRRTGKEMQKWPELFNEKTARMVLFNVYVFIDIGGTGGGIFRYMYARFLQQASEICENQALTEIAKKIHLSGDLFTKLGLLFKDYDSPYDLKEQIEKADEQLNAIADLETEVYQELESIIPST